MELIVIDFLSTMDALGGFRVQEIPCGTLLAIPLVKERPLMVAIVVSFSVQSVGSAGDPVICRFPSGFTIELES
jgi:hypothetical protein